MNTVTISVERFLKLLKCEEDLKKPRRHTIILSGWFCWRTDIETDDDAVAEIAKKLDKASDKIFELEQMNIKLQHLVTDLDDQLSGKKSWWRKLFAKKKRGLPDYKNPPPPPKM